MHNLLLLSLLAFFGMHCSSKRASRPNAERDPVKPTGETSPTGSPSGSNVEPVPPAGTTLVWKRYRALESGLSSGLSLSKEQLCVELGSQSCIDAVHLTVLGGNEPFVNGQYDRAQNPTVLTAVAMDRLVLSGCSKRLALDKAAGGNAVVFKFFALNDEKPTDEKIRLQASELYRRLLAREAEAEELQVISTFGNQGLTGDKVALSLCFAIGTSAENIFL